MSAANQTMATRRLFGTDGIRAPFGEAPLDRSTVTTLGFELAGLLSETGDSPSVVLGGDTRFSTPELCRWLAAGLTAGGARVRFVGTLPTPGIAWLTRGSDAAAGVAVSASHNPWQDNGIKLIGADGFKWTDEAEAAFEARLEGDHPEVEEGPELVAEPGVADAYLGWLATTVTGERPLSGLKLAVDAAHGAASALAAPLLEGLGAEVVLLFAAPDGRNINRDCGSTHTEALRQALLEHGCDLGIAFDGDADRVLFVDDQGRLRDGDATLFLWAGHMHRAGELEPASIVATSMSNLGLERALSAIDIGVTRCDVGDRAVVATMREDGLTLGGEQSGHIVHLGLSTTGDGLLTALQIAALLTQGGRTLSQRLEGFRRFPQVLKNLVVSSKPPLEQLPRVREAAARVEETLGAEGRLVLRYSGTEPLARVMIEGPDQAEIERLADEVLAAIDEELGDSVE